MTKYRIIKRTFKDGRASYKVQWKKFGIWVYINKWGIIPTPMSSLIGENHNNYEDAIKEIGILKKFELSKKLIKKEKLKVFS